MLVSFLLIIFISSPYPEFLANIMNSIFMTFMLLLVFHILGKMDVPIKLAVIATYSIMSGYMQHDKLFGLLTIAIGCLTIVIGWLIKSRVNSNVISNQET
jgi:ABC-type maltose transport system permease subunit